jgi:hypothetical protein
MQKLLADGGRTVVLVLAVFVIAACSPGEAGSVAAQGGPLLTVETRGGECLDGPCGSTIVVERDGTVHSADQPPTELGTVPEPRLAALDSAIKLTDFALLKARPFTGECPTAFDGQEFIFEFGAPGGVERIATCEVDVNYPTPLFAAVAAALEPFTSLPR